MRVNDHKTQKHPPNMNDQKIPEKTFTRRDFLKTSTVAASAVAVGSLDVSRSAHAAGSDIIKVGMIGCGGRNAGAGVQALTADPGARLVAMCGSNPSRSTPSAASLL